MRLIRTLAFAILVSGPALAPAQAETVADLRAELTALSSVVADLARELSSGSAAEQPGFDGALIDRVERTREELARLTGRTEELEFRIRRTIDEASNRLGDLEFRMTELEGGDTTDLATPRPLDRGETTADGDSDAPELAASERTAFDSARDLAENGDYDAAAEALQQFLEFYPGSPLGADASMLLGDMHRARGSEPDAARAYLNLYLADSDGADAPRALLALGESLGRLEQREEACVMFDELLDRFASSPQATEASDARARLECP